MAAVFPLKYTDSLSLPEILKAMRVSHPAPSRESARARDLIARHWEAQIA